MEAWKQVNYTELAPLVALSLTTSRWGLEILPGNIKATQGYFNKSSSHNVTALPAWNFTYGCAITELDLESDIRGYLLASSNSTVSARDKICVKPTRCGGSDCINLVEGVGKTVTGPAHSDIFRLAHGVSALVSIAITIAMGCLQVVKGFVSGLFRDDPPPLPVDKYTATPKSDQNSELKRIEVQETKAAEIVHCANLLREMYQSHYSLISLGDDQKKYVKERDELRRKRDALYGEIDRIASAWKATSLGYFTGEERKYVDEIYATIQSFNRERTVGR